MKLKDLPQPIRELAEKRIREQGNEPYEELNFMTGKNRGGFNWSETEDGFSFWNEIYNGKFDVFYQLNPIEFITKKIDQLNAADLAKVAEHFRIKIERCKQDDGVLTVDYLMRIYPSISIIEAHSLLEFCQKKTITHIECYGYGSKIYPQWEEHIKKLKNEAK